MAVTNALAANAAWQTFLTNEEIKKIQASQALQKDYLEWFKGIYGDILSKYNAGPNSTVPNQFNEAVNLFQPGGQYGAGAKAEIDRSANQALAAGQIGLTKTGMSSGTNVAGLNARVASDTALARQKVEDQRIQLLAGSLQTAGQAGLTAQQIDAQRQAQLMQLLGSFPRIAA